MLWAGYFYEVLSPTSQMMNLSSWMGSDLLNVVVRLQMLRLRPELSPAKVQMRPVEMLHSPFSPCPSSGLGPATVLMLCCGRRENGCPRPHL